MFSHVRTEKTLFRLAHETMKKRKAKETKKKKKWGKQAKSAFYDTLSIFPREPANSSFRIFLKAIPSSSPTFFPLSLSLSFFLFLFKPYSTKRNGLFSIRHVWKRAILSRKDAIQFSNAAWMQRVSFDPPIEWCSEWSSNSEEIAIIGAKMAP